MSPNSDPLMFTSADWRLLDSLEVRNLSQLKGITDDMAKAIIREVSEGVNAGEGISKLSSRISKATGVSKNRATVIARTETINAATDAALLRFEQYGVTEFRYIAASDTRVCARCAANNGKVFKTTDLEHRPPIHPQCRCAVAPIIPKREKKSVIPTTQKKTAPAKTSKPDTNQTTAILESKTFTELKTTLSDYMGHNVEFVDFVDKKGRITKFENVVDLDRLKESFAKSEPIFRDFPELKEVITEYSLTNTSDWAAFITDNTGRISFGLGAPYKTKTKAFKEYLTTLKKEKESGFHPADSIESIFWHEYGHFLVGAIAKRQGSVDIRHKIIWIANDVVDKAAKISMGKSKNWTHKDFYEFTEYRKKKGELRSSISDYAIENDMETIAEAFADYYANKGNAKEISKNIVNIVKEELKHVSSSSK